MAVVNLLSTEITNRDATPPVRSNASVTGAELVGAVAKMAIGAADAVGSTYRFTQLPSNARISQVIVSCDAIDSSNSSTMDIGFYDTTANGGAIIGDGDQIAAALDISAALSASDVTHQGAEDFTIAHAEYMVWQILGLSTDPNKMYDLVGTLAGADSDQGGNFIIKVQYTV